MAGPLIAFISIQRSCSHDTYRHDPQDERGPGQDLRHLLPDLAVFAAPGPAGRADAHVQKQGRQQHHQRLHLRTSRHTADASADRRVLWPLLPVRRHAAGEAEAAGHHHRLLAELRGLLRRDLPRRHRVHARGPVRGRPRAGLHQASDLHAHHTAPGRQAHTALRHQRGDHPGQGHLHGLHAGLYGDVLHRQADRQLTVQLHALRDRRRVLLSDEHDRGLRHVPVREGAELLPLRGGRYDEYP